MQVKGAVCLAAGFGSRLRPITNHIPKPLAPVLAAPILEWDLSAFRRQNLPRIYCNTHHLSDSISQFFAEQRHYLSDQVQLNHEQTILGTGGGVANFCEQFDDQSYYLIKAADIFIPEIEQLLDQCFYDLHELHVSQVGAMLICADEHRPGTTQIWTDAQGKLEAIGGPKPGSSNPATFMACQILKGSVAKRLRMGVFSSIIDLYQEMLRHGETVAAPRFSYQWFDIGTPQSLWSCNMLMAERLENDSRLRAHWNRLGHGAELLIHDRLPDQVKKGSRYVGDPQLLAQMPSCTITGSVIIGPAVKPSEHIREITNSVMFGHNFRDDQSVITHNLSAYSHRLQFAK